MEDFVMKIKKRIAVVLLSSFMLVSSLTVGCQQTQPTGTQPVTETTADTSDSQQSSGEESKQAEFEGTINVNLPAEAGAKEGWEAVAKAYMEIHPKVKVVIDLKPQDGYAEWVKNMFGTANPTADLVGINLAGAARNGKSINYMEYLNVTSPYSGDVWMKQFDFQHQNGVDMTNNSWDQLSLQTVQILWMYNKEVFQKVGVEPPETWKEFAAVCEKLQKAGYQPLAVPGDFDSFYSMQMGWLARAYTDQTTRSMLEVYRSKEGDYNYDPSKDGTFKYDPTDPYNDESSKVTSNIVRVYKAIKDGVYKPDSEGMLTVWSNLKEIFPKYAGGDAFFGTKDALPLFYQGKAAIYLDGAWRLPAFKTDMDKLAKGEEIKSGETKIEGVRKFTLGTFNMPSMEGPGIEAPARTIEAPSGFMGGVAKDKAHDDMVMDFVMYYSSKTGYDKYLSAALNAGFAPSGPTLVNGVELPDEYAELFKDLKFIGNCQKAYNTFMSRGAPKDIQESLREWYNYSQEFLTGKTDVKEWGKKHKENVMKYLPQSMKASKVEPGDLDNPQNAPTGK